MPSPLHDRHSKLRRVFQSGRTMGKKSLYVFCVRTKPTNSNIMRFYIRRFDICRYDAGSPCYSSMLDWGVNPEGAECRLQKTNGSSAEICAQDAAILWQLIANWLLSPAGCLNRNQRKDMCFIPAWWKAV